MAAQGNDICSMEPKSRSGNTTIYQTTQNSSSVQNAIGGLFTDIIGFVQEKEFQTCIEEDDEWINILITELSSRKKDLYNTESAIVVSGETSSGKTSTINLIIGEDILPVDIEANTTRLCRIKNSARRSISTLKEKDCILNTWTFQTTDQMTKKLNELAEIPDSEIKFVDILLPVQMLKGNTIIVDTPGIGDKGQTEFVNMTMEYIPNALAFIFVVNVVNAGGLQDDRLPVIFKQIRESMKSMYSHSPDDAIFLLNKWDALVLKHQQTDFFEKKKKELCHAWPEAKADHIIKFAAAKVEESDVFREHCEKFKNILQEVIDRNINKRMFIHLRYLNDFLEQRKEKMSTSQVCLMKIQDEISKKKEKASIQIKALCSAKEMFSKSLDENMESFMSAIITRYLNHITDSDFKQKVFADIEPFTRFQIEKELKGIIVSKSHNWWKENVANIFKSTVMLSFIQTLQKVDLQVDLSSINKDIEGLEGLIDVNSTLWSEIKSYFLGGGGAAGGLAISRVVVLPFAIPGLATAGFVAGMLIQGAIKYKVLSPFQHVTEEMFKNIIDTIKAEDMENIFRNRFAIQIKDFLHTFLKEFVNEQARDLNADLERLKLEHETCSRKSSILESLQSTIDQYKLRIKEIENFESSIE